ncbi:MAG: glutaredoxin family protein [bacterium]
MKQVYVFGKPDCPVCKDTREKLAYFKEKNDFAAQIKYYDMDTVDGLTEGAYHEVEDIPTVIIFDDKKELIRWVKKPPVSEEFLPYLT